LEELLTIYNLYIVNDTSEPTFKTTRCSSYTYVDLTIVNHQLIRCVTDWTCGKQESSSDHKIIIFNLGIARQEKHTSNIDYVGIRYIIKNGNFIKFEATVAYNLVSKFNCENNKEGVEKINCELCDKLNLYKDVNELVDTAFSCITTVCNTAFRVSRAVKHVTKKTTVSWWTDELTVLRKSTNAVPRRYQRTTNNENLRQERKANYYNERREYKGKMQDAKLKSWKEFCTINDGVNPWNIVY
jgi:hypothetical protein